MAGSMVDGGLGRRAGIGAKLALKRLNALHTGESSNAIATTSSTATSGKNKKGKAFALSGANTVESDVSPPKKANDIDAIITQELLVAYSRGEFMICSR